MNALCEEILAECPDSNLRFCAIELLAGGAVKHGNIPRALAPAESLPSRTRSREEIKLRLIAGDLDSAFACLEEQADMLEHFAADPTWSKLSPLLPDYIRRECSECTREQSCR